MKVTKFKFSREEQKKLKSGKLKIPKYFESWLIHRFHTRSGLSINCDYETKGIHWIDNITEEDLLDLIQTLKAPADIANDFYEGH